MKTIKDRIYLDSWRKINEKLFKAYILCYDNLSKNNNLDPAEELVNALDKYGIKGAVTKKDYGSAYIPARELGIYYDEDGKYFLGQIAKEYLNNRISYIEYMTIYCSNYIALIKDKIINPFNIIRDYSLNNMKQKDIDEVIQDTKSFFSTSENQSLAKAALRLFLDRAVEAGLISKNKKKYSISNRKIYDLKLNTPEITADKFIQKYLSGRESQKNYVYDIINHPIDIKVLNIDINKKQMNEPLNQILYGPPGTGKTYSTITKALTIIGLLEEKDTYTAEEYAEAQELFQNELGKRVEFVTMHQSFSYEDFVQGIKPVINKFDGNVFIVTNIEDDSANDAKENYQEDINREYIYDSKVRNYKLINSGDLLLVKNREKIFGYGVIDRIESNDALKKNVKCPECSKADLRKRTTKKFKYLCVSCRHEFNEPKIIEEPCIQYRAVWKEGLNSLDLDKKIAQPYTINFNDQVSMQQCENRILVDLTISPLKKTKEIYFDYVDGVFKRICNRAKINTKDNFVIILDEINRANISRVFGELIALVEQDKRDGKLTATLPSRELFTVPSNLYIIGTMNTADKSIALVDIALRRRFVFKPLYPDTDVLERVLKEKNVKDEEIELRVKLLTNLNKIIRTKKSVDFEIGHSYFMEEDDLVNILNKQVLPLLNEYFMYDLRKVKNIIEKSHKQKDKEGVFLPKLGITLNQKIWEKRGLLEVESSISVTEKLESTETTEETMEA